MKTGTRGRRQKNVPGLILVNAGHADYVKFHHAVKTAIDLVLPLHAVRSIDEFACELTGTQQQEEKAVRLAQSIKDVIKKEVGEHIKASIGIAPNFLLAKIAADMQKPDGLTVLNQNNLHERLIRLKLQDIPGIGPRMERRLHEKRDHRRTAPRLRGTAYARTLGKRLGRAHAPSAQGRVDRFFQSPSKSIGHHTCFRRRKIHRRSADGSAKTSMESGGTIAFRIK